ncbi:MAG: radical SAM protein, partial [Eggerthellaceae bacterium]|nr:radical SAM protein [Eggerthellaceae bacterium]
MSHVNDIAGRLRARVEQGARYAQLGITGGEPLLHADVVLGFLDAARTLAPDARVRLYTSGAGLTEELAYDLAEASLHEVRFSVKLDEPRSSLDRTLAHIGMCTNLFDAVMVEMPVMPDQVDAMKELLLRLDNLGVRAINL